MPSLDTHSPISATNDLLGENYDDINEYIRGNSIHSRPDFDFAIYVKHRSYVMQLLDSHGFECAALLDSGVRALLRKALKQSKLPVSSCFVGNAPNGKGLGLFAFSDISRGKPILVEQPSVVVPYLNGSTVPPSDLYADLLRMLSPSVYNELMSLRNSFSDEKDKDFESIINTSSFAIELQVPDGPYPELAMHRGIFLQTTRCNHSCGPNAKWEWDPATFSLTLIAVRPIQQDEEITVAYVAPDQPHQVRYQTLRSQYGFDCQCEQCLSLSEEDVKQSDIAREIIRRDYNAEEFPSFEQWCSDPTLDDDALIKVHLRSLFFIDQEGLEVLDYGPGFHPALDVGRHADAIAMCYAALADEVNFRYWMARAMEMRVAYNLDETNLFKKWISNPQTFPVWGCKNVCRDNLES